MFNEIIRLIALLFEFDRIIAIISLLNYKI